MQPITEKNIADLCSDFPSDVIVTDYATRAHYSQDIFTKNLVAKAVAKPCSAEQLIEIVRKANALGYSMFPRGGGASYTSGYTPTQENSLIIDLQLLNRVLEINESDRYVTVQAGCTWKTLHDALAKRGLRTPFWGSLSGLHATVGGSVSQNSIFWGAGQFGGSSDSVLGLSVVTAEGKLIRTGSGAHSGVSPFSRYYGPDLTGLFCCDCGALGIKSEITLRIIRDRDHHQHVSFEFDDYASLLRAMSELTRREIGAQMFATDPGLAEARSKRESLIHDIKSLRNVVTGKGKRTERLVQGAKIVANGRSVVAVDRYSLHITLEEFSASSAKTLANEATAICQLEGGSPLSPSIPTILRANPFGPLNNVLGPKGERWVPIHAIVPLSKAEACMRSIQDVFYRYKAEMDALNVSTGYLVTTVHNNELVIEPLWFWPDKTESIHESLVEASVRKRHKSFSRNPMARTLVESMRGELLANFQDLGAIHLQIGRTYSYAATLNAETKALLKSIKAAVDPDNTMNPGCLGL